jgi:hypothetical protein
MVRLVLLLVLLGAAIAIVRSLVRGQAERRVQRQLDDLRATFLHGQRPDRSSAAGLRRHRFGGLSFELPATWEVEGQGELLTFRVGAIGDGRLQVLQRNEREPAGDPSTRTEELPDGRRLIRRLVAVGEERVQYAWWLRSTDGHRSVSFLLESTRTEAVEAFRQADVATIDWSAREARFDG